MTMQSKMSGKYITQEFPQGCIQQSSLSKPTELSNHSSITISLTHCDSYRTVVPFDPSTQNTVTLLMPALKVHRFIFNYAQLNFPTYMIDFMLFNRSETFLLYGHHQYYCFPSFARINFEGRIKTEYLTKSHVYGKFFVQMLFKHQIVKCIQKNLFYLI